MNIPMVERLRDCGEVEAADIIELFVGQMQATSMDMGGQHRYRFRSSGWPMSHAVGPNAVAAVAAVLAEVNRHRTQQ